MTSQSVHHFLHYLHNQFTTILSYFPPLKKRQKSILFFVLIIAFFIVFLLTLITVSSPSSSSNEILIQSYLQKHKLIPFHSNKNPIKLNTNQHSLHNNVPKWPKELSVNLIEFTSYGKGKQKWYISEQFLSQYPKEIILYSIGIPQLDSVCNSPQFDGISSISNEFQHSFEMEFAKYYNLQQKISISLIETPSQLKLLNHICKNSKVSGLQSEKHEWNKENRIKIVEEGVTWMESYEKTVFIESGVVVKNKYKKINEILSENGDGDRYIDVLKLDLGGEMWLEIYEILESWMDEEDNGVLNRVGQLLVHLYKKTEW
eukprot:CAMPEP_0182449664 /NCGR_PEP_ID=MMETSP1172-20130603/35921_1 /TAXON_ID=708627 /ORGANISM="Timspurckia oligopyrenoides, Strain CCMP3278" /LENGTH=315 /DNA_ID=CAMNT_0024647001 /DNA_START=31 /DNA_END=975 /DNA_ORIENTATION=+